MHIDINGNDVEVIIDKKISNKNTYLRVKKDLKLYVTTSIFTSDRKIKNIINENYKSLVNMYNKQLNKKESNDKFYYFGLIYDKCLVDGNQIKFGDNIAYIGSNVDIDKWYKKQANIIFQERLDYWYNNFTYKIPYPSLTIRKMTSRWGVCNSELKRVTLNLELIKKEDECLDYVIVHELSHFIEMNHSNRFWKVVGENYPNYKEIRKKMKDY